MSAKLGKDRVKQLRPVGFRLKLAPDQFGTGKSVTQKREVARTSAARCKSRQRPGEILHGLERDARSLTADCVLVEPGNQGKSLLNRLLVGERRGNVLAKQAAPSGSLAAIDFAQKAAGERT